MDSVETITLNNGVEMPALGLGVFQTPPEETRDAVRAALESGCLSSRRLEAPLFLPEPVTGVPRVLRPA